MKWRARLLKLGSYDVGYATQPFNCSTQERELREFTTLTPRSEFFLDGISHTVLNNRLVRVFAIGTKTKEINRLEPMLMRGLHSSKVGFMLRESESLPRQAPANPGTLK
jgi:hypothetical protein